MKPPATRLEPNYDIKMELKTNRYRHKSKLNYDIDSYGSNNRSPVLHSSRGIAKVTPITIQPYVRLNQPNSVIPIPSAPTSSIGLTSTNGSTTSTTAPTSKPSIHNPLPIATVSAVISSVSASSAFGVNEPPLSSSVTNVQSSTTTTSTTTTTSFPIGSINKSGRNGKSIDQQYRTTTKSPNTATTTTTTTTETSFVSSDEESNLCFLSNGGSSETFTVNEAMPIDSVIGSIKFKIEILFSWY
ncbi:hypothetical protein RDWZM_003829 [Blomia tropicalis]|uniref:Uncharacterized protein n=1 Tax=Blomia tropicalis TaxID=40697 RepID=A0A9Q0MGC5_BLOTA|nr:hypothetical protein RDWZM_003829 [Blomia tropicalis]